MSINSYSSLCDDFYVDMYINTELELPSQRDTLLAFFERVQRQFPSMGNFYRRETGRYCLEEDGQGRWVTIEPDRIGSGVANPAEVQDAYSQHRFIIELAPYMLGVNHLDIDSLDVTFGMDFDYQGNHNEIIAEALLGSTAFQCLLDIPNSKAVGFSPAVLTAISDDCRTQVRIAVEPKTTAYEIRSGKYKPDEPISLYFTVRQYPKPNGRFDALKSFENQCVLAEALMAEKIVPNFVRPLMGAIGQRRSI